MNKVVNYMAYFDKTKTTISGKSLAVTKQNSFVAGWQLPEIVLCI